MQISYRKEHRYIVHVICYKWLSILSDDSLLAFEVGGDRSYEKQIWIKLDLNCRELKERKKWQTMK
jgi:hypothetical protein